MSSIHDESEPSGGEEEEYQTQRFAPLRHTDTPKIVEPSNEALVLEDSPESSLPKVRHF